MIRNSIALQDSNSIEANLTYFYKGTNKHPEDFFKLSGENWFWTGHGIILEDKLVIFLFEESPADTGLGFEAIGWYVDVINNPSDNPDKWIINYYKGPDTFGVIVGSSAVVQDENYVYAFGVKEPATHETYLLRFDKRKLITGDLSNLEWWNNNAWIDKVHEEQKSASLFYGQTEFSVHFDRELKKLFTRQMHIPNLSLICLL